MMNPMLVICYLAAIVVCQGQFWAILGIIAVALASCPSFWKWANRIKELTIEHLKIKRRK